MFGGEDGWLRDDGAQGAELFEALFALAGGEFGVLELGGEHDIRHDNFPEVKVIARGCCSLPIPPRQPLEWNPSPRGG